MDSLACGLHFKTLRQRPLDIVVFDRSGYPIREILIAELEDGTRIKIYEKEGEYYPFKFRDCNLYSHQFKCEYYNPEKECQRYNWTPFILFFVLSFLLSFFLLAHFFFPRRYIGNPQQRYPLHPYPLI